MESDWAPVDPDGLNPHRAFDAVEVAVPLVIQKVCQSQSPSGFRRGGVGRRRFRRVSSSLHSHQASMRWRKKYFGNYVQVRSQSPSGFQCGGGFWCFRGWEEGSQSPSGFRCGGAPLRAVSRTSVRLNPHRAFDAVEHRGQHIAGGVRSQSPSGLRCGGEPQAQPPHSQPFPTLLPSASRDSGFIRASAGSTPPPRVRPPRQVGKARPFVKWRCLDAHHHCQAPEVGCNSPARAEVGLGEIRWSGQR